MNRDETTSIWLDDDRIKFFADRTLEVARIRAAAEPSDDESDKEDLASYAGEVVSLRKKLLALMAQLEDAKAAQALVLERAANLVSGCHWGEYWQLNGEAVEPSHIAEAIRALADPSGVEALAALRDQVARSANGIEGFQELARENMRQWGVATSRAERAEAEAADLRARLAAAEAGVGALREALKMSSEGWRNALELDLLPRQHRHSAKTMADVAEAALASAQGGAADA